MTLRPDASRPGHIPLGLMECVRFAFHCFPVTDPHSNALRGECSQIFG
jgi:hypothetical protein